jgi:hypothetical protein
VRVVSDQLGDNAGIALIAPLLSSVRSHRPLTYLMISNVGV